MGFSGMHDIVVLLENILDIALSVKNPRWPPFAQDQTINWYIFRQNRSRLTILVSTIGFSGIYPISWWGKNYLRHCIVGKIQDGRHLSKVKQYIGIIVIGLPGGSMCQPYRWFSFNSLKPRTRRGQHSRSFHQFY